jgi:hypothetical protein
MSSFYDIDGNTILTIPFPEDKFKSILGKLGYPTDTDFRKAPFEQKRIAFLASFREFLNGHLFLEEFCDIANSLTFLFDVKNKTTEQADYELMIYEAADLSLYVRNQDSADRSMFAGFMVTIWDYFNKYKYLLDGMINDFPPVEYFENPRKYKPGEKLNFSFEETKRKIAGNKLLPLMN